MCSETGKTDVNSVAAVNGFLKTIADQLYSALDADPCNASDVVKIDIVNDLCNDAELDLDPVRIQWLLYFVLIYAEGDDVAQMFTAQIEARECRSMIAPWTTTLSLLRTMTSMGLASFPLLTNLKALQDKR